MAFTIAQTFKLLTIITRPFTRRISFQFQKPVGKRRLSVFHKSGMMRQFCLLYRGCAMSQTACSMFIPDRTVQPFFLYSFPSSLLTHMSGSPGASSKKYLSI
ncbi:hypothetical protein VFPPC_15807 [Pochonia chlamydosporia 170]|uniref:Uncharacterized protein n=1 Tax=Pochonia chlamydosporia 170 TaxID=1380566 RepID=A0A179FRK1_METCM|nr:hypothetical protein VFPPC_15807 [Pochonia chlamydosporia 170]OAQ68255.1 hypothetical protein VFPPC_15807 [Pochonia chlamydosporia 170]